MDRNKIDLEKKHRRSEDMLETITTELSDEELSKISGGSLASACCTGKHIVRATIIC